MKEEKKDLRKCSNKNKIMFAYGFIQISSRVVSAIALAAIALGLCSIKNESKLFNNCVEEVTKEVKSNSKAVRYCNGGN